MKFSIVIAFLGVFLAPAFADEDIWRPADIGVVSLRGPRFPPGPRVPPGPGVSYFPTFPRGPRIPVFPTFPRGPRIPVFPNVPRGPHLPVFPNVPRGPSIPVFPNVPRGPHVPVFTNLRSRRSVGNEFYEILPEQPENWKTVWDAETGFIATKVLGKNTCIISKADASFPGLEGFGNGYLPPIEHRYIISSNRLQNLEGYGPLIQRLCSGIPSYFAFPSPGSNFMEENLPCIGILYRGAPISYCGLRRLL